MAAPGHRADAVTALTIYVVMLLALPSRLIFGPLGGAGAPAQVLGLSLVTWWGYHRVSATNVPAKALVPVRYAFLGMFCAFLMSYVVGMLRPLAGAEKSTADLGLVLLCSWAGIVLLSCDGTPTLDRYVTLVRRLVFMGGAVATLGIAQFVTGQILVDRISIPGLSANQGLASLSMREGFHRPPATAIHPIEFGAVITMILPLALMLALEDTNRARLRRWYPVGALALTTMISISRSAIVAAAVGVLILSVAWKPLTRLVAAASLFAFMSVIFVTIPGLLGTLTGLFTGIKNDTSARSRTDSYAVAWNFIERSPVFGRGFSTFLPSYHILDNQYLLLFIEVGAVGLGSVLLLIAAAIYCAASTRRSSGDPFTRHLAQAMVAAVSAGAVGQALFDGFGFPMAAGLLFLLIGMCGGLYRLVLEEADVPRPPPHDRLTDVSVGRPRRSSG